MTTTYQIIVLVETDNSVQYFTWTGSSVSAIKKKARELYAVKFPNAEVTFGNYTSVNNYGTH